MPAAIEVANVSKSFRRYRPDRPMMLQEVLARGVAGFRTTEVFWALRDVSFSVPRGRAVGIIGTNGSGKSTLLRLTGGIGSVDSGSIRVRGRIGALLDLGSGIHPDLTGRENVIVAGVLSGLSRREVMRRFDDIVAFSEIGQFIDNPMRTYSSGMQMRLAFAINVHTNPDVLLIDEVLAVGDAAFQRKCLARIKEFKANGCSILLVSHGLAVVQKLCDEVIWMHYGQKMAQGPVRDVVEQYEAFAGVSMEPELVVEAAAPPPVPAGSAAPHDPAPLHANRRLRAPGEGPGTDGDSVLRVALLDERGRALERLPSGAPLTIAIDTRSVADVPERVRVRVTRHDGLVCCDFREDRAEVLASAVVTLTLSRLDLAAGEYTVDVAGAFAGGADERQSGLPLMVEGPASRDAVLVVPHRWHGMESAAR